MTTNKTNVKRYDNMGCPEEICRLVETIHESDDGDYVLYEDYEALQAECEKLRKDAAGLKARVAKLEGEDTLWAMLDAIEKALFRKAAPHAWESVVTSAGSNFIVSRRKSKEPANEGDRHA